MTFFGLFDPMTLSLDGYITNHLRKGNMGGIILKKCNMYLLDY